jgi:hypothetical protein
MTTHQDQRNRSLPPRAACSAKAASVSGSGRLQPTAYPQYSNRGVLNTTSVPEHGLERLI